MRYAGAAGSLHGLQKWQLEEGMNAAERALHNLARGFEPVLTVCEDHDAAASFA